MFAVGFLRQVLQLLSVHGLWTCKNANMVAYAGMKAPQEYIFKVQFILHVMFVASYEVCSSDSRLEEVT